ncbi:hypothetical protein [Siminovitchia terrae]|uniref:Uncharacterized protein n=1 Tax=Siminovitchia terrae TaxID=1914933 RepID=A0A429XC98_SIMTE|nr:hypothetical protein [Siminovitchia terrae]RST60979.1 hypothetical protein D5F11_002695 [Siminovitchia terrae]
MHNVNSILLHYDTSSFDEIDALVTPGTSRSDRSGPCCLSPDQMRLGVFAPRFYRAPLDEFPLKICGISRRL